MSTTPKISGMTEQHWPQVSEIYREGIASGEATFETEIPSWEEWDAAHLPFARLIATTESAISGWAALSQVSLRRAYAGVAEVSVYVAAASRGQGIGRLLLDFLIVNSEKNGIWTLQASIFPENVASTSLHVSAGFRVVGHRNHVAKLNGVWRDTILMERRSSIVGIE